mmetsp:Transcript_94390/g.181314  ORF Transcript_94390/g.181314 Transcript_94390/m.181314 type:complete len:367 (-) Transcript_94390:27-1127(-)
MADDSILEVEFFDGYRSESREDGEVLHEDFILTVGGVSLRITVDQVPPGFEAPEDCPFAMEYPMCVMRGSDVKKLSSLVSHAEASTSGMLLHLDFQTREVSRSELLGGGAPRLLAKKTILLPITGERVLNPLRCIVYFVHRWPSPGVADNSAGSTLRLLQGCLLEDDYAWMDVWSVPDLAELTSPAGCPAAADVATASSAQKAAAMRSMPGYIFRATRLCLVASSEGDFELCLQRAWCQAELFAAFCPVLRRVRSQSNSIDLSMSTKVYRHACPSEVVLGDTRDQWHGGNFKGPLPLEPTLLRDPLHCGITFPADMTILEQIICSVKEALAAARPRHEVDELSGHETIITGMKLGVIDLLVKALSN